MHVLNCFEMFDFPNFFFRALFCHFNFKNAISGFAKSFTKTLDAMPESTLSCQELPASGDYDVVGYTYSKYTLTYHCQ
jgi:hypothetical protein